MKISLFQGVFIAVFGIIALIGVFVFATSNGSTNGGGSTDVGTVVVWGTLPKTDVQNALAAISQSEQSIKGVSYVEKDVNTLPADLASAIATGAAPDLVLASQEVLLPLSKLLTSIPSSVLSPATFTATFAEGGTIYAAPSGGYYGVPFLVDPLVLFANRGILSSEGVAKPPATWEALTGLVPNVAILTPTKQITRGLIALGTYANVHNARAIISSLFLQTGMPISAYTNGAPVAKLNGVSSATGAMLGQAVLNFYTQFADPTKVSYTWNASRPDSQQAFLAGDVALYIGYASEARFLKAANPNLDFIVSALPQPATAKTKDAYGLIYAFMIPRGAQNPNGAYQAAVLLAGEAPQAAAASAIGVAPAALAALAQSPADPVAAIAYAEALYTNGWLSPLPADTDAVFSAMITDVITGRLTLDRALTTSESSLTALLQK